MRLVYCDSDFDQYAFIADENCHDCKEWETCLEFENVNELMEFIIYSEDQGETIQDLIHDIDWTEYLKFK